MCKFISDKKLISKLYKEFSNATIKQMTQWEKSGEGNEQILH